jgi:hypothetical protein
MSYQSERVCGECGQKYTATGRNQKLCPCCKAQDIYNRKLAQREYNLLFGVGSGGNQWGDKNCQWRGGHTVAWAETKAQKLASTKHCEECGKDLSSTIGTSNSNGRNGHWAIHHMDLNRANNSPENLKLLCKRCHQVIMHNCKEHWGAYASNKRWAR